MFFYSEVIYYSIGSISKYIAFVHSTNCNRADFSYVFSNLNIATFLEILLLTLVVVNFSATMHLVI